MRLQPTCICKKVLSRPLFGSYGFQETVMMIAGRQQTLRIMFGGVLGEKSVIPKIANDLQLRIFTYTALPANETYS